MRLLKNRQRVLDIMMESKHHLTVKQIYEAYQEKFGKACFATVYNSVNYLRDKGKLREVDHVGGNIRYEAYVEDHDHLICRICGQVHDVDVDQAEIYLKHHDFIVERKTTTYHGVCKCCLDRSKNNENPKDSIKA